MVLMEQFIYYTILIIVIIITNDVKLISLRNAIKCYQLFFVNSKYIND